ncbi:short-chain dehydrogenase [Candidatus Aerophobetes bacterium]|uniref:Short-chain dehydrogenase n=1 Tax=Aerophobetes bacterium TaxID=2030807 RepID=A0A662DBD8_UNCAE|nr:MAG: short-chain dehydrogenase [Candidatus Aerophobetes bacterium]
MRELEGRVAVVTGGARGIGKAICQTLAREGARVAVCDVDYKAAEEAATEMRGQGLSTFPVKLDVSYSKEVKRVFEDIINKYKKVDILINNAGICYYIPFEKISEGEWDRVLAVNLKGTFLCCQAVMQSMISQGWGKIVNISSVAAKIGGILAGAHYSASKAGVICLTKSLARRMAPHGVNVNAICPGQIKTRMTDVWSEEEKEKFVQQIPLGHFGEPQDIAEAVLFLVSERAKFITGEIIDVNGGFFMD